MLVQNIKSFGITVGAAIAVMAVFLGGTSLPARAESMDARLARIERDIDTLSRSVFKGEKPSTVLATSAQATLNAAQDLQNQFDARITQIEQDLRDLTNKTEEQGHTITQLNQSISDLVGRVSALEQKLSAAGASALSVSSGNAGASAITGGTGTTGGAPLVTTGPPSTTGASHTGITTSSPLPTPTEPNGPAPANSPTVEPMGTLSTNAATGDTSVATNDPTFMYENALELLKQRDYGLAEKSLTEFLAQNPTHTLVPNAKYWLGEAYFAQNKFDAAARIFAEGYQKYPKGPKAPDNLLKLGLSLAATNKTADACVAFKQIGKDFPNGATAMKTRAASEIKKLKCP